MAKYLITGGAGFIGSNIAERLVNLGETVRIVDNLSSGKIENIRGFLDRVEFIKGDLAHYHIALKAVEGIDYILHHSAIASVQKSIDDPIASNESIVTATVNLFKASVEAKTVKRIVQAVSSAAYGDSTELPKREEMMPQPLSPYAVAKLTQEYYAKVFYNIYGLQILSLRYFNVFGPKQDPYSSYSGVIPKFTDLLLNGKQPVIYGDGETSRDFVYIDDVVNANLLAVACNWPGNAEIINIGRGEKTTLNELVKMLNKILGTNIQPVYESEKVGDAKHSVSDISKARKLLKYSAEIDFYKGLEMLVHWFSYK